MGEATSRQERARRVAHMRAEAKSLVQRLTADGRNGTEIADVLRARCGLNARAAQRIAHGWTQEDVARLWNERWPDDFKTHKNISYWETWQPGPGKHGYAPSFDVLDKLARLYACKVSDLLVDLGDYQPDPDALDPIHPAPHQARDAGHDQSDAEVADSQAHWQRTRRHLNHNRPTLATAAARLYRPEILLGEVPLLTTATWTPDRPVDLRQLTLTWEPERQPVAIDGTEPEALLALPLRAPGDRFRSYTSAVRYVDPPALFENRPSYRLLDLAWTGDAGSMTFGLATYFDKLDISEALGQELAAARSGLESGAGGVPEVRWDQLPLRRAIGDPFDLASRAVVPAITTLTLIRDRAEQRAGFLLHWRDAQRVATAGGQYDVIPAGEFQPSSVVPWAHASDLDLWRNIVREYSEELCGTTEHDGSHGQPVDYAHWPFYRAITHARDTERLHAYCLGAGLDALTLAATIPTVVVIDHDAFAEIFGAIVRTNAEGTTVSSLDGSASAQGIPFTEANVRRFLTDEPMAPPGAACLALAWRHRNLLLGPDTC